MVDLMKSRVLTLTMVVIVSVFLSACGNGNSMSTSQTTYTIGGMVAGLSGTGLVLQNNGSNTLPVGANGGFTFTTAVASGGAYDVTVLTQPSSPAQSCLVTKGSGTASANVMSILVTCVGDWTWVNGANVINQQGTYGTLGTPAPSNVPAGRDGAVSSVDTSGNLWLFGGMEAPSVTTDNFFNDLWKYSAGEWTWMGGSNVVNQAGVYGTPGVPALGNIPGARVQAVSWSDRSGDFWVFGGIGLDSTGGSHFLNDLWRYSAGEWTWMSGSNMVDQTGTYGTEGTPAAENVPGARFEAVGWTDISGDLWLFGGSPGPDGQFHIFNDLWKYSAGEWTWMSGSNGVDQLGTYGNQGLPAVNNVPGARVAAATWSDASGNLWLFGGDGFDSVGSLGYLNDLWKYSAGKWIWMDGSNMTGQPGTYGTLGMAAPSNVPGGRFAPVTWIDASGNFWLFGGDGSASAGSLGYLNDLWKYEP